MRSVRVCAIIFDECTFLFTLGKVESNGEIYGPCGRTIGFVQQRLTVNGEVDFVDWNAGR